MNLRYLRGNSSKEMDFGRQNNAKGLPPIVNQEELFIGSVFLSDVSKFNLSGQGHKTEYFGRLGLVVTKE
ncbi:hypothetical protein HZY62_13265 [Maribacter polysiphoniae]|nr:hypothetical protein [Maribacter polysiphoniae]MBD1261567.1 hypothetical protein [Maribacter polysiphoniae]